MLTAGGMFLLSAVVILVAGTKLSHYADQIAEHSGLGRLWIGVVLLAGATSLPEVFTAVSAVLLDEPNIAVGNLVGAGLSNMLTLALIDLAYRQKRIWQQAALEHALIAGLAIILTGLAGLLIMIRQPLPLWHIGLGTAAIAMIYVFGMRVVFRQEDMRRRAQQLEKLVEVEAAAANPLVPTGALRRALMGFALAALGVLVAAPVLAEAAKELAEATGISTTFIGTSLVAITTTLPELVTTFAAVRLGAYDLAVGNLFGSNAFNMAVLLPADLAYGKGLLLAAVEPTHAVTAFVSILLMSIGMMGIIYRAERRFMLIEPDSLLMIVSYGLSMWLLFRIGA